MIPEEIRELILRYFDSVEAIEIVLLLHRSANTFWGPSAVAQRLGIAEDVVSRKMAAMAHDGILAPAEQSSAFRFAPADESVVKKVEELGELYATRRVSIINIIYSANLERLRTFSNAFKLKNE